MSDIPIHRFYLARWRELARLIGVVMVIIALPALLVADCHSSRIRVSALWPSQVFVHTPTRLPINVQRHSNDGPNDLAGTAKVWLGYRPERGGLADAVQANALREVAEGSIGTDGIGVVEIPPQEPLSRPEHVGEGELPFMVVRVNVADEEQWFSQSLAQPISEAGGPVVALTLDRPLYQPGQTIMMRAIVASAATGKPLDTDVQLTVRDARNNLVMDDTVSTGSDGVASATLELADRCVQGTYQLQARVGTDVVDKSVDVRPFRLPRYKVSVQTFGEAVPGQEVSAKVVAKTTYGDPVAGADVNVTATLGGAPLPVGAGNTDADGEFALGFAIPKNALAGTPIEVAAQVITETGRTETASAIVTVAGRGARLEIIPAGRAQFAWGASTTAIVIVHDQNDQPLADAAVTVVVPESAGERRVTLQTDALGRATFDWTPDSSRGSALTTKVVHGGETLVKRNIHLSVGGTADVLVLDRSDVTVGDTVKVSVPPRDQAGLLVLWRDGSARASVRVEPAASEVAISVPAEATGFCRLILFRGGSTEPSAPLWVRQKGGDKVDVRAETEVRPGVQTSVHLSFPPPTDQESGAVTFGLVGVDEALYALKERADVPLTVLMRRAPSTIFDALQAFDPAADDNLAGLIATHRFRSTLADEGGFANSYASDFSHEVRRAKRAPFVRLVAWLLLIGVIATALQMGRWTWRDASRDAFSGRRFAMQLAFAIFTGLFAAALLAMGRRGEAFVGGLSVWSAVVACWLLAVVARTPSVRFGRWLAAHVAGVALAGGLGICLGFLSRGAQTFDLVVLQGGIALPALLLLVQWVAWAFVLMRDGYTKAGLGVGSFAGIFTLGMLGGMVTSGGVRYESAPTLSKVADMAEPEEAAGLPQLAPAAPPADGATGAPGADAGPRVRSWFPETMVWLPQIRAGADGSATVEFEVPDSITTWRLDAWANTSDGRFGHGTAPLLAVQPYFLELDLPMEVIDGDRFEVPIALVNRSDATIEVDLEAQATGPLQLGGLRGGAPTLEPGARVTAWLQVAARGVGDGTITVKSETADGKGDAVQRRVRVQPDGRLLSRSSSAIIGSGWESVIDVPREAIDGSVRADVRVFGSLVADALAGLESMLRQPDGCFEQTSSANYPNVMVLRALRDMKPQDWPDGAERFDETRLNAQRLVDLGVQRILTFQKPSGGFALYPDRATADQMLTAYGILQLVWASDVTQVDPEVIERAANWLSAQQKHDGSFVTSRSVSGSSAGDADIGLARATSFVVMALAATKNPRYRSVIDRALVHVEKRIDAVESANALAWIANGLSDAGSADLARRAVDRLAAMARREADVAYWTDTHTTWMGGWGYYAAAETTALATQAMLATQSQQDLLQPALNWISSQRRHHGGWGSTQATVWTLRALETLRSRSSNDATLRFYAGPTQLTTVGGMSELHVTSKPQPLRQFDFVPPEREARFVVDASAETTAMVQLVQNYAVSWTSRLAEVDGEAFGGEVEVAERRMTRGVATRAYARVENLQQTEVQMVIIEAPIPPGAFVPSDALDALVSQGAISMYEVLPTHVRLYVDHIPAKSERVYAYDFVPLVRGTFSLPPLRAYPFYSPEPTTEVDGGEVSCR